MLSRVLESSKICLPAETVRDEGCKLITANTDGIVQYLILLSVVQPFNRTVLNIYSVPETWVKVIWSTV